MLKEGNGYQNYILQGERWFYAFILILMILMRWLNNSVPEHYSMWGRGQRRLIQKCFIWRSWRNTAESCLHVMLNGIVFQSLAVLGKNYIWKRLVLVAAILMESGWWVLVHLAKTSRLFKSKCLTKSRSTFLWTILCIITSRFVWRLCCRDGNCRSFSIAVTELHGRSHFDESGSTSLDSLNLRDFAFGVGIPYRTTILYMGAYQALIGLFFTFDGALPRLRRRNPIMLFVLETALSMWVFHFMFEERVTPRYLWWSTAWRYWPDNL